MNVALNTKRAVTAALVAAVPGGEVAERSPVKIAVSATVPTVAESSVQAHLEATIQSQSMAVRIDDAEWSDSDEHDFDSLAMKEALGTIAPSEASHLEALTRRRRDIVYPRTEEEILWDIRQRRNTLALVDALTRYVEFYTPVSTRH
jgi:hypothetical protein